MRTVQTLSNRFVDVVYDLAPAGTSRSVVSAAHKPLLKHARSIGLHSSSPQSKVQACIQVETTAKGALLLVTLSFASSIVSVSPVDAMPGCIASCCQLVLYLTWLYCSSC